MKDHPLIIAGSGRSGTTWVLDVIAEANNLRTVFEPLCRRGVAEARAFGRRYVREHSYEPELRLFMEKVFHGELKSVWTDTRILPDKMRPSIAHLASWDYAYTFLSRYKTFLLRNLSYLKKRAGRPITKFIRANLMLDWLEKNFHPRIVFIVRHPGAVAASKMAAAKTQEGSIWDFSGPNEQSILLQYKHDEQLRKDYLDSYYDIFSERLSPVAGYTLLWCIENVFPLYNRQKKNHQVFFYEDIVTNPEREFAHMVKILGLERNPDSSCVPKASQQASREFTNGSPAENQITRWMKSFTRKELGEIDRVLKLFKVSIYNAYEPMPVSRKQECI